MNKRKVEHKSGKFSFSHNNILFKCFRFPMLSALSFHELETKGKITKWKFTACSTQYRISIAQMTQKNFAIHQAPAPPAQQVSYLKFHQKVICNFQNIKVSLDFYRYFFFVSLLFFFYFSRSSFFQFFISYKIIPEKMGNFLYFPCFLNFLCIYNYSSSSIIANDIISNHSCIFSLRVYVYCLMFSMLNVIFTYSVV